MPRYSALLLAMATLAATPAVLSAQAVRPTGPSASVMQSEPAPIEHAYPTTSSNSTYNNENAVLSSGEVLAPGRRTATAQPAHGIYLRVGRNSVVREVSSSPQRVELRVERGLANVNVHDPVHDSLILVDLPGGQTQLLKNGLYTFNADTDTARVLKGEAYAFPGATSAAIHSAKRIKVKENHAVDFLGPNVRSTKFEPYEASTDLIPAPYNRAYNSAQEEGYGAYGYGPYAYGPYGDGFWYGYPYYAFDYGYPWGWGWGYPYGFYGYPYGIGLGYGYYGGFHGYHGYHGGGWHGGSGFHGGGGSGFHGGGGGGFHGGGGGGFHGGGGGASHGGGGGRR